ncbi:4'-phosphopantetheinyl transferase [Pilimelia terevasa]|uniref:4'-phosphopantetheinyl transferase n=1 Tax=Pilimelia terevasa TaxID=53372 RepID=A0A8J3BL47_9ACTN|nr:4'-phosphopantetheinyl transferase superfamily protein [Pilimelia terevasa]GGK18990.1 4'-phosphopantetheinyl transferase [Pilimelia terevasa]
MGAGSAALSLLAAVLPADVRHAEARGELVEGPAYPEEVAQVARAVPQRRREYLTVRACARRALAGLGHPPVPLPRGEGGAPAWPPGVVGSMTHCAGFRGAAVAAGAAYASLGVDAEPDAPLPEGVRDVIALPGELAGPLVTAHADRLLFCAKEAVYKAWYPLAGRWLGFEEARVSLGADGTFHAALLVPGPPYAGRPLAAFEGRWLSRDGLLLAAIALPAPA